MKIPSVVFLVSLAVCALAFKAPERRLTVAEVAGHETLAVGQMVSETRQIDNGPASRIQLNLGKSMFRLGANSVATINGLAFRFELRKGSCLFDGLASDAFLAMSLGDKEFRVMQGT